MAASSIKEKIAAAILARFDAIVAGTPTGKSGSGTTFCNSYDAQRFQQDGNDLQNVTVNPIAIIEGDEESPELEQTEQIRWIWSVWVIIYASQPDTFLGTTDEYLLTLDQDVKNAVLEDRTWTGNAIDTDFGKVFPFEDTTDEPFIGVAVELLVQYQHSNLDTNINI